MSKAVIISIRPEWCEKIASGQKTIEVRKNRPKIDTPFKVYIYESHGDKGYFEVYHEKTIGKVIGEFICNQIDSLDPNTSGLFTDFTTPLLRICMSLGEIIKYNNRNDVYLWYISDLVIYDKPKELSEFRKPGYRTGYKIVNDNRRGVVSVSFTCENAPLQRPPQSWCYVEELK